MIRVLHIDTGLIFRGGQRQVDILTQNLRRFDLEQYLACPTNSPLVKRTSHLTKEYLALSTSNLMRFIERGRLKRFIKDKGINIIHAHDSHAHSLAVMLRHGKVSPKLVVTRRSSGGIGFGSRTKYLAHDIRYIAISHHIKEMLVRGGIPEESVNIITSMIDLNLYRESDSQKTTEKDNDGKKVIVSAGALDRKKGYLDAVKAVHRLSEMRKDFNYYLYGDGPEREKLSKYIIKYALSGVVKMPGWQDNPLDYLRNADIFLSPSHEEGLGISVVEAMAARVAIIATEIEPRKEIIEQQKTGLLFPAGDVDKMVERLNQLLNDSELAQNMIRNAEKVAARFDCRQTAEQIYRLYCEVVAPIG